MEINITKPVKVNAKTLKIHVKCSDRFSYAIADQHGEEIYSQDDGYVPDFMPGEHYGDYIMLDIDIDSGVVVNWSKPTAADIEAVLNGSDD
jgi:hypothetical protein